MGESAVTQPLDEELFVDVKAGPAVMTTPVISDGREFAAAVAAKKFLMWALSRHLSSQSLQKLPGISGFISLTGNRHISGETWAIHA